VTFKRSKKSLSWKANQKLAPVRHFLVTNDFPPKVGGIQNALFEIYKRLPPESFAVITPHYPGDDDFDSGLPFKVIRVRCKNLLPTKSFVRTLEDLIDQMNPQSVALNPILPIGMLSKKIDRDVTILLWGAEAVIPARLPVLRSLVKQALSGAKGAISCANYTLDALSNVLSPQAMAQSTVVYPGVDSARFEPATKSQKAELRVRYGFADDAFVIFSISRLVPRKGMDVLISAAALAMAEIPNLVVAIAGDGRERRRLEALAKESSAPIRFFGRVSNDELVSFYQLSDLFSMLCYNRWFGLEQEGFGIVFLEAAASGLTIIAGDSGGSAEAVGGQGFGFVLRDQRDPKAVAQKIIELYKDPNLRSQVSSAARERSLRDFNYEMLADKWRKYFQL
ncbi:unnamed protein product, partial [Acidithrix sp. C25]